MDFERIKSLRKYHQTVVDQIFERWSLSELVILLGRLIKPEPIDTTENLRIAEDLMVLVSTDAEAIEVLMIEFDDLPIYLNSEEFLSRKVAVERLKIGK
jgi:hypothetical protein